MSEIELFIAFVIEENIVSSVYRLEMRDATIALGAKIQVVDIGL